MRFEGLLTALVTPFRSDGSVDHDTLRALVTRQVEAGVDGLVPCGTTGEAPTLDYDEHVDVIRITVEASQGRPVMAGIGSNNTATAIRTAKAARGVGATGVLATAPYYNKPTQEGLYRHFAAIAEAVPELGVCVYDVPGRTSVKVHTDTIGRLAQIPNVTCAKDATADLANAAELVRVTDDDFAVLSGDDFTALPTVAVGGKGCVSVASNLIPERVVALMGHSRRGELAEAAALNAELQPLFRALFVQTNPLPVKTAMASLGLCEAHFRLPLCPMDEGPQAELMACLAAYGLR
ncbi:MAG: 4-hydroxy-tetrahydrodipicolinate synthase [Myxococcales bacterium]|nr:4-hydroxy-tetrahydrodipicolinate synthase [Myxococcales bacterium]